MRRGSLIVLSAPSGTGKSSLVRRLVDDVPGLVFSVSATTRKPRRGEKDGVDYHFLDRQEFLELVERGDLLEHAEVHGELYGTLREATERELEAGRDVLLEIDVQGAAQVRAATAEAHLVFILPPSRDELEGRLRRRGLDPDDVIRLRLANAAEELRHATTYDFVLVNDDLDETARALAGVVRALRSSGSAMRDRTAAVLDSFGVTAVDRDAR